MDYSLNSYHNYPQQTKRESPPTTHKYTSIMETICEPKSKFLNSPSWLKMNVLFFYYSASKCPHTSLFMFWNSHHQRAGYKITQMHFFILLFNMVHRVFIKFRQLLYHSNYYISMCSLVPIKRKSFETWIMKRSDSQNQNITHGCSRLTNNYISNYLDFR